MQYSTIVMQFNMNKILKYLLVKRKKSDWCGWLQSNK